MLEKIFKTCIKKSLLKAYLKQRKVVNLVTFSNAKNVGVLWNPLDEASSDAFELLRKILIDKDIRTTGIAYVESRKETESLSTVSHSEIFNRGNIWFFGRPKSGSGVQFMQESFDILIDLSILKAVPLQYILIHSKSKFKVGWKALDHNFYDLEIDVTLKPECLFLMEQIVHYLENINDKKKSNE